MRGLLRLGILKGGVDGVAGEVVGEVLARGTVVAFFPHGLGHHVGLEVHDVSGRERLLMGGVGGSSSGGGGGGGGDLSTAGRAHRTRVRRAGMKRDTFSPATVAALCKGGRQRGEEGGVGTGRAAAAAAAVGGRGQMLAQGMIVTVEPGM